MHPGENLADLTFRTEAGTSEDVEQLGDATTPEEMYGAVVGHRAPASAVVPDPESEEG
jgi:hypothetical protein